MLPNELGVSITMSSRVARRGRIGRIKNPEEVMTLIEQEFHAAMFNTYQRGRAEHGYNANRFLWMLDEHQGVATAHMLLEAKGVSEGYVALWERGGLGLTVEAVVLEPRWRSLFS